MAKLLIATTLTVLLSVLSVESTQTFGCTFSQNLDDANEVPIAQRPASFYTPNYPSLTPPGLNCRWRATRDEQQLSLNCRHVLPNYGACNSRVPDRIEVISGGRVRYYCGSGALSISPAEQLVFRTSKNYRGGSLACTAY